MTMPTGAGRGMPDVFLMPYSNAWLFVAERGAAR